MKFFEGMVVWARDTTHNNYQKWGKGLYVMPHQSGKGHWIEFYHHTEHIPLGVMGWFTEVKPFLTPCVDQKLDRLYL